MKKEYSGKVPLQYNKDGTFSLMSYYNESWNNSGYYKDTVKMIDNEEFIATLHYVTYSRGESSVQFLFDSDEGNHFNVFMTDMNDILMLGKAVSSITGKWIYTKRGANYAIKYLGEA